jgi:hypothetical protein
MPRLYLLIFEPTEWYYPDDAGHWALYVPSKEDETVGDAFEVKKASLVTFRTEFGMIRAYLQNGWCGLRQYVPLNIDVPSIASLSQICYGVTEGRSFNIVTKNCQHWVCEVLEEVIKKYNILNGEAELRRVKAMGHNL